MTDREEARARILGPFTVTASSADLASFGTATNLHAEGDCSWDGAPVPLSYLPTLLGHPSVKPLVTEVLQELVGSADASLVHVHQDVLLHHPLEPDRPYGLIITCQCVGASIIEITSKLSDPDLGSVAQMLSKLMIAPAGEAV